jgi:hypothetical protein
LGFQIRKTTSGTVTGAVRHFTARTQKSSDLLIFLVRQPSLVEEDAAMS